MTSTGYFCNPCVRSLEPLGIVVDQKNTRVARLLRDGLDLRVRPLVPENLEDQRLEVVPGILALMDIVGVKVLAALDRFII